MQAQRESKANNDGDSGEEDESPVREKPQRPPNRRKKSKEPLVEEDIIDGFAILGFKSYDDLEVRKTFVSVCRSVAASFCCSVAGCAPLAQSTHYINKLRASNLPK